jgi:hypothetical protein
MSKRTIDELIKAENEMQYDVEYRDPNIKPLNSYERNRLDRWKADADNRRARLHAKWDAEDRKKEMEERKTRIAEAKKRQQTARVGMAAVVQSLHSF